MKDQKIKELIELETERQRETLDLIASENIVSHDVRAALGSVFTNKYSEGYPGRRYYPGNKYCDDVETLAKERALALFELDQKEWDVNVQPYSGSPANLSVYTALTEPGDVIMGMRLADGGHLTHGHKVSATGIFWKSVQYGIDKESGLVDYDELERLAREANPKVIISGFTAYPREFNFKKFGDIAKEVGAYHLADISHIAGLVVARVHPAPFPHADVVMTTTHKSLRGPRGAIIFSKREISEKIDKAVFPGLQGGPHDNVTAAKAVAFFEALQPEFEKYGKQIVKNAGALAKTLIKLGFKLVSGGTDTHLILVDVRDFGIDGAEAQKRLENVGIIANRNSIPGDPKPFRPSGIRLGTPSLTTRGMKEKDMEGVGQLIYDALHEKRGTAKEVLELCKKFPAKDYL